MKCNSKNNFIYNSVQNNSTLWKEFNKRRGKHILETKSLLEDVKEVMSKKSKTLNKWKDIHFHGSEDLMLLRWQYSPH